MQLFRKVASNALWQIIARIVSSGTSFLITILIARSLGVTGYGDLAKITAFVSLFYLFVDLGLNAVFLQLEGNEKKFTHLFSLRILVALILFLFVGSLSFLLPYNISSGIGYSPLVKIGIIFFGLTFFGRAVTYSTAAIFQRTLSYRLGAYASIGGSFTTLLGVSFVILTNTSVVGILVAYILGSFVEALLDMLFAKEKITTFSLDKTFTKTLLLQTFPITLMLVLNLVYFRVDMLLLSVLKPTTDVAIYDFAYKFFDFLIALPLFLSNSLYPTLLATGKNTRMSSIKLIAYMTGFILLGVLVAVPVWFASPLLVFVKKEFSQSSYALRLLLLSLPIFFATNIVQWIFIAKKRQTFLVFVYATSLLLNICLNVLFIPHFSYAASAIITGVSELGVLLALLLYLFVRPL